MAELDATTEMRPMLSAQELQVARANLRFALDNCPVDGGVLLEDGGTTSRESVEALLGRLEAIDVQGVNSPDLSDDEAKMLEAVADYALEECPIEGGMVLDNGRLVSRADIRSLRQKVEATPRACVPG